MLLAAVAVVTFVWLRQQRQAEAVEEQAEEMDVEAEQDELLDAIAKLDDEFETGRIEEVDYRRQRAKLKAELKELMKANG